MASFTKAFARRRRGRTLLAALLSAAATGGALLLAGPGARRRRALARDRVKHVAAATRDELGKARRDLAQRAQGVAAHVRPHGDADVDDVTLVARARGALGHVCSHPHAVQVQAAAGVLTLKGDVLAEERRPIRRALARVPGVADVVDQLTAHDTADGVPALQGGRHRVRHGVQGSWTPAARLLAGTFGAGLLASTFFARRSVGVVAGVAGGALLARAVSNRSWLGPVEVKKSILIHAPVGDVFAFFQNPDRFPRFTNHVLAVERLEDDRWSWRLQAPLGELVCHLTRFEENQVIEFCSERGRPYVEGCVQFHEEHGDGREGTRVDVDLLLWPAFGAAGYTLSKLMHRDVKHYLDDDLLRLKSLLEHKKATGRLGQITLEEVARV